MNRIKPIRALLFAVALLASLVVSSGTASATSAYDDTVRITQQLTVEGYSLAAVDVSASYTGLIQEHCSSGYYDSLVATVSAEGEYAISKVEHGTGDVGSAAQNDVVMVTWSEDSSGSLGFQTEFSTYRSLYFVGSSASYKSAQIYMDSGGNLGVQCMNGRQMSYVSTNKPGVTAWDVTVWLNTFNITYPSGYEGVIPSNAPPPTKYIAMGDSYMSGEGNEPFEYGTDTGTNTCHRSTQAWPRLLQNDPSLELGSAAFVACSGAVSDYIINAYNQENVELPQAAFVTSTTQLITISIGGNDVGFGNVLVTCTQATEEEGTTSEKHQIEHDACIEAIDDSRGIATSTALQDDLEAVFSGLRTLGNQNLQVVVVGYPNLLPAHGDIVGTCVWGNGELTTSGRAMASDETQKSRLLHDELNATIEAAVDATSDSNIHFVDPSSAFAGHELCRPAPWFNNVVPNVADPVMQRMSYHPDGNGQAAYATVVGAEVDNLFP